MVSADMAAAVAHLLQGGLVAMPTETVYGLAADAENPEAIKKIYAAKQRPADHPLIVHIAPEADLTYWARNIPSAARQLVEAFWPGPLTLILPKAHHISDHVTGGQPTIGLRCPSHPVARELIARFAQARPGGQGGLAAPSANKFGQVSPTTADHVRHEFPELADQALLILDGGPSQVGIESTIVDVSMPKAGTPTVLRPGHITVAQIESVLGRPVLSGVQSASPRVSGSLKAHYAPRTVLRVLSRQALRAWLASHAKDGAEKVAAVVFAPFEDACPPTVRLYRCPDNPDDYGRNLYAMLRDLDQQNYDMLLVEQPPQGPAWSAVNDRLGRAAAAFIPSQDAG